MVSTIWEIDQEEKEAMIVWAIFGNVVRSVPFGLA
jgi:hypothetical protein